MEFYDRELLVIAEKYCEKVKNLSEHLLNDNNIAETTTQELEEFKLFLVEYLRDYQHFKRFNEYQILFEIFIYLAKTENNEETDVKFKAILSKYFHDILSEYEFDFKKFVRQKLLTKFEDLLQKIPTNETHLKNAIEDYKLCESFACFPTHHDKFIDGYHGTTIYILVKYYEIDFKKYITLVTIRAYNRAKTVLDSTDYSLLTSNTKEMLLRDINEFCEKFENSNDIEEFALYAIKHLKYPKKYLSLEDFPLSDREILKEITNKLKIDKANSKFEEGNKYVMQRTGFKIYTINEALNQYITEKIKLQMEFVAQFLN